jgi:acyltransferase-like protein
MHGYIYIILKESLKNVPIVGWGAQFYNFIFLSRNWEQDQAQFQAHLDQLNKPEDPMWLLIFPEGTNLAKSTRERSKAWADKNGLQDMKHQLLPRSRGLQFCLQRLGKTTDWLYDCTIAYEGIPEGEFGQDIFTLRSSMFEGRPPKSVNMHFRRFKISTIPLKNDKAFEVWLRNRWREKDYLLEHFSRFNRFPEDDLWMIKQRKAGRTQLIAQPAKSIETQIKSNSLEEFLSIFAPLTSVLMVVFLLSGGANPSDMMQMLGDASTKGKNFLSGAGAKIPGLDSSKASNGVAGKVVAPNAATMSDIGRLTPAAAQKELIHKYLSSVRPTASRQISLPEQSLHKPPPSAWKNKAPSVRSQPTTVIRASPSNKITTTGRASSIVSAPPGKGSTIANLRLSQRPVPLKPVQKPKAPSNQTSKTPIASKVPPKKVINTKPATNKATTKTNEGQKKGAEGKNVTVSPAMLSKMKGNVKPSGPKPITINPKALAQLKSQKRS